MSISQKINSELVGQNRKSAGRGTIKSAIALWMVAGIIFLSCSSVSYATDWSGVYGGANVGYGFEARDEPFSSFRDPDLIPVPLLKDRIKFNIGPEGIIGGLQIGYNHEIEGLVLGLEADFQGSDLYDSGTGGDGFSFLISCPDPFCIEYDRKIMAKSSMDAFGTLRGRLGFHNGPLLAYATVGLIYGHVQNSVDAVDTGLVCISGCFIDDQFFYVGSEDEWKAGLVVGAGLEYMVWENISIKVEWLYYNLQNSTFDALRQNELSDPEDDAFIPTVLENTFQNNGDIIRVGANWRFWGFK